MNLKDFLQLAGSQGKVLVMGEDGNPKGVFLPYGEYQKLLGTEAPSDTTVEQVKEDLAEKANREILQAQLEEVISTTDGGTATAQIDSDAVSAIDPHPPERIDSLISKRANDLFKSIPNYNYIPPEVATSIDEEIKPNFDDI